MDFAEGGRHLISAGVETIVYRNTILQKRWRLSLDGFAAKQAEDKKFKADADSTTQWQLNMADVTGLSPLPWRTVAGSVHMARLLSACSRSMLLLKANYLQYPAVLSPSGIPRQWPCGSVDGSKNSLSGSTLPSPDRC